MSNTAILEACNEHLSTLVLSPALPILWPGITEDPPNTGMWLEANHFPNGPENIGWGNSDCSMARGYFQVAVGYRPGIGQVQPSIIADAVAVHFAKGTVLGPVRIKQKPDIAPPITEGAYLLIPVRAHYLGLTQ